MLEQLYSSAGSPAALSSAVRLYDIARKRGYDGTLSDVREFLETKPSYTKHRKARRKFPRNRVECRDINSVWMFDLADYSRLAKWNDKVKFLFHLVDCVSKKGYVIAQKNKTAEVTLDSFKQVVLKAGVVCEFAYTDKGTEWTKITKYLNENSKIHAFAQDPIIKSSLAERFVRTIKDLIYRYLTENKTLRYIDSLQLIVDTYNSRKHRSIGMSPNEVSRLNVAEVKRKLYPPIKLKLPLKFRFKIGDFVRVQVQYSPFNKGSYGTYSDDLYIIKSQLPRVPVCYEITHIRSGDDVAGVFYENELTRSKVLGETSD